MVTRRTKMQILDVVILLLSVVNAQKDLSLNVYLTADLAISGTPNDTFANVACSVTLPSPPQSVAWWMFTFPVDTVFITNVNINYRSNVLYRFTGYSLYVSNSSISKTDGYLCYHHEGPERPSADEDRNCNHLGQYVIIYNERNKTVTYPDKYNDFAILELCKVRIDGCYKGWWDSDCSNTCPATCVDRHCYPSNGSCVWGCNPENCLNDICDTATGKCTQGCNIGLHADYCDKECELGKFGNNCTETCNCVNQPCDHITGICPPGGCLRGYARSNCSTECNDGYFGMNCEQQCYCRYGACIKATGICPTKGCQRGWKGDTCSEECSDRDYGFDCVDRCNTCHSTLCERFEGNCTYGCIEGFKGHRCLVSVTSQSDHTLNIIYAVIGTIIVTTLVCVTVFLVILRYRRGNCTSGDTNKQNRQSTSGYRNDAYTNDYANIGNHNAESHYEATIPSAQEQPYDTI